MPNEKELRDLDEEYDPALPYIDGSNLDGASWDRDDYQDCHRKLLASDEFNDLTMLHNAFPGEYQKPSFDGILEMITNE